MHDDDFGFTFSKEENYSNPADKARIDDLNSRLTESLRRLCEVRDLINPLLKNLAKSPDKEMIKWPNRKEVLEKISKRLEDLTKV